MATEAQKIQYAEVAAPSTPAANKVVTYAKADGLMYSKDDAGAETLMSGGATATRASLGLDTTDSPQFTAINLGHASDTTIARVSAGVVSIEGTNIVKAGAVTTDGITMATARLLGRTTASTGAIEEITVGTGLSLAAGSLTATGAAGTSFPGSPATNDRYFRTDLGMEFYWDGTNWVSTQLNQLMLTPADVVTPFSGTTGGIRGIFPVWGGSDIWLVAAQSWFFVNGGTALSGSHKWVGTLAKQPAGTTIATQTIDSGASSAYRQTALTAIGALLGANYQCDILWTKTGTPGTLFTQTTVSYRYVAT
jgi:hypothetical protein